MKPKNYPQGSEWRKWDLQIHTPFSYLNNQFGTDWDNYVKELFKRAIANEIAVIGITDYFCIEGYKKIKTEYLANDAKLRQLFTEEETAKIKDILILPDIEFRLDNFVEQRVNFHVIFSDEISITDIEENFLHELDFVEQGHPQNPDEKRKLKITHLQTLGERLKGEQTEFAASPAIQVGMMNAVVDHTQITDILSNKKSVFENKYLIGLPADEDLSGVNWNSQGHLTRKILYQKSDFFFSSNANTHDFCLGLKHPSVKDYITEFHTLKPCVWSSDAHECNKMFCPDEDRHTWIKANPSFEGLRQIVFEPAERVKIQPDKPDLKRPYFIIDKVRFIDNTGKNNFASDYIPVNQNLNAVIGGKSTGKSLLLYYVAKTVDETEVNKESVLGENDSMQTYSLDDDNDFDFEVVWKDGETMNLKKLPTFDEEEDKRKIIYIPQHYLNQLSEKEIQSKQTLNAFIENIILQDKAAAQYHGQKKADVSKAEKEISKELNNLFSIEDDIEKLKAEIKALGDERGVSRYIEELKKKIEAVKKKTGLSTDELKKYEDLVGKIKALEEENTSLLQDKTSLEEFANELKTRLETDDLLEEYQDYFSNEGIKKQFLEGFGFVKKLPSNVDAATKKVAASIDEKVKENTKSLTPLNKALAPLLAKVKMQKELDDKQKLLKKEEEKLSSIQTKKKNLQTKKKTFDAKKEVVLKLYKGVFATYEALQSEFKKYSSRLKDIDLSITVGFNDVEFNKEVVEQFLNKNDLKLLPDAQSSWNERFEYQYNPQNHLQFITSVFDGILGEKVSTIRNRTRKDALQKLLENKFYVDFKISYKTDSLDKMSPGKKGLVLLKILIDLSDEEWPIILDQPEDDLDNRSVYTDLVAFIKTKKRGRQIIIATHNPNLVVGADAEEIIVANQDGQEVGRDNARFRFEYISGALEHSFKDAVAAGILNKMGVRQHVCDVLEGGEEAFQKREQKYSL